MFFLVVIMIFNLYAKQGKERNTKKQRVFKIINTDFLVVNKELGSKEFNSENSEKILNVLKHMALSELLKRIPNASLAIGVLGQEVTISEDQLKISVNNLKNISGYLGYLNFEIDYKIEEISQEEDCTVVNLTYIFEFDKVIKFKNIEYIGFNEIDLSEFQDEMFNFYLFNVPISCNSQTIFYSRCMEFFKQKGYSKFFFNYEYKFDEETKTMNICFVFNPIEKYETKYSINCTNCEKDNLPDEIINFEIKNFNQKEIQRQVEEWNEEYKQYNFQVKFEYKKDVVEVNLTAQDNDVLMLPISSLIFIGNELTSISALLDLLDEYKIGYLVTQNQVNKIKERLMNTDAFEEVKIKSKKVDNSFELTIELVEKQVFKGIDKTPEGVTKSAGNVVGAGNFTKIFHTIKVPFIYKNYNHNGLMKLLSFEYYINASNQNLKISKKTIFDFLFSGEFFEESESFVLKKDKEKKDSENEELIGMQKKGLSFSLKKTLWKGFLITVGAVTSVFWNEEKKNKAEITKEERAEIENEMNHVFAKISLEKQKKVSKKCVVLNEFEANAKVFLSRQVRCNVSNEFVVKYGLSKQNVSFKINTKLNELGNLKKEYETDSFSKVAFENQFFLAHNSFCLTFDRRFFNSNKYFILRFLYFFVTLNLTVFLTVSKDDHFKKDDLKFAFLLALMFGIKIKIQGFCLQFQISLKEIFKSKELTYGESEEKMNKYYWHRWTFGLINNIGVSIRRP